MEKLLTRKDVAVLAKLSVRTVDEYAARGELHPIRIGRAVRFTQEEVGRWLRAHLSKDEGEVANGK